MFQILHFFGKQTLYADNLPRNLMPRTMVGVGLRGIYLMA